MSSSKRLKLKKKAWRIFSEFIRKRDNYICFTCGKQLTKNTSNAGHFIPQSSHSDTMFDEINVNCQCPRCNKWKHGNLGVYAIKLIEKYGKEKVDELIRRRDIVKIWKIAELEKLIIHYTRELQKYD